MLSTLSAISCLVLSSVARELFVEVLLSASFVAAVAFLVSVAASVGPQLHAPLAGLVAPAWVG